MHRRLLSQLSRMTLLAMITMLAGSMVYAQPPQPAHYTVTDLGTLGGSFSLAYGINNQGQVDGFSTLSGDALLHSFVVKNGTMIDLGTLGGPNSLSFAGLNNTAQTSGQAEIPTPDPNGEDFCGFGTQLICLGFVWQNGVMRPLSTLGGNNGQSTAINNSGQVAGLAETGSADPACPATQTLQFLPVIWNGANTQALPLASGDTVGGAFWINNAGDAVGASGICAPFDPRYGSPIQPRHALLWRNGQAIDLGNLGGAGNNTGLGINDAGDVVGASDLPGDTFQHAFLWHQGVITDLGTLPGDVVSAALGINNRGQITGVSIDGSGNIRAFLWQNGTMYDLNALISPDAPFFLLHGFGINDQGQIAGFAVNFEVGEVHAVVMSPSQAAAVAQGPPAAPLQRPTIPANARRLLDQTLHSRRFFGQ